MPANLENSAVATGLEKVRFHSSPKERQCQSSSAYCTIALMSQASKVMLKILQARLQQHVNRELPDVQAGFRKGRGTITDATGGNRRSVPRVELGLGLGWWALAF